MWQRLAIGILLAATGAEARPQGSEASSPLDPLRFGVVYDVPETEDVTLEADVPYLKDAKATLAIDVYQPPGAKRGEKRPAVVFLNTIGDEPPPALKLKSWGIYKSWPRLVAAHGLVGVSMECDGTRVQESLAALFDFLAKRGAEHGIDGAKIGVYAASANVSGASEFLFGDHPAPGIRAAALYYGQAPTQRLRADLPVLFVVAESDVPRSPEVVPLWQRVVEARAPWTMLFGSRMPHAFDGFSDTDEARRIIQQTIAFWRAHLEPMPPPTWDPDPARDINACFFANDMQKATGLLKPWVAAHPDDGLAWMQYGRALAETSRFQESTAAYERAAALGMSGLGIDLALGLARVGQQRWKDADERLTRVVAAGMVDSRILGSLGYAQLRLGKVEAGVQSYERALEIGIPPGAQTRGIACFNLACGYARLGRKDQAFEKLGVAVDEGFKARKTFEDDADLATLKADPRFKTLLARLAK